MSYEIGKASGPVLYVGRMPGRKRIQLAIRDGSVVRSIAGFTHEHEAQEFVDLLADWLGQTSSKDTEPRLPNYR